MILLVAKELSKFISLFLLVVSAQAASVTWVFETTVSDEFSTDVFGQVDYDTTTDVFSNLQLNTTSSEAAWNQFVATGLVDITGGQIYAEGEYETSGFGYLQLNFSPSLTSQSALDSGVVEFVTDQENLFTGGYTGVTGTATLVPVPAAVWLFGSALAGLGWLRRKQTI